MIKLRETNPNTIENWDKEYSRDTFIRGNQNVFDCILKNLNGCNTVYDYGCGMGELISFLADNGKSVLGYERSPIVAERAMMEHRNIKVSTKPIPSTFYDAVLCCEVLEHLDVPLNLSITLQAIAKKKVIITVPAEDSAEKSPYHVWLFEEKDFSDLFTWKVSHMEILPTSGNYLTRVVVFENECTDSCWD